jgi:hypothetical protein
MLVPDRLHPIVTLVTLLLAQGCMSLALRPSPLPPAPPAGGGLHLLDSYLADRIQSLELRSPSLRGALDSVRARPLRIVIGTPAQLALVEPWTLSARRIRLAQLIARVDTADGAVQSIIVEIDLAAIARHRYRSIPPVAAWFSVAQRQLRFDRLVDDILIHEIWGHLVPLALVGNTSGACRDPQGGENDLDSCVMKRENALRAELGSAQRRTYALADLW